MISINPNDYNIYEKCRLVVKNDSTDQIVILDYINEGETFVIKEENILNNINDYKFLFQIKKNKGFRNLTSYNYFFDSKLLEKYFLNQIQKTDEEAHNILSVYWKTNSKHHILKPLMRKTLEHIWKNRNQKMDNLKQMVFLSDQFSSEISLLWKNIISFINSLITLYSKLSDLELLRKKDFLDFISKDSTEFKKFLENEIENLSFSDLQLDQLMMANYYSYLDDRENAAHYYEKIQKEFLDFDPLKILNIESNGVATYKDLSLKSLNYDRTISFPTFKFYSDETPTNADTTIIFSVDRKFLKAYGIQLLYSSSIINNIHFHFHIIDDDAFNLVRETDKMFDSILEFRQLEKFIKPTFSYETLPDKIVNDTTYYACARFIHADYFLEKFNNEILILDADFYIIDEFDELIKKCRNYDIATSISSMALSVFPWRRFMAGMVYLGNNDVSKEYTKMITGYILNQIENAKTWTLDQNALTFGFEQIRNSHPNVKFGNMTVNQPPVMHPRFRSLIEKI